MALRQFRNYLDIVPDLNAIMHISSVGYVNILGGFINWYGNQSNSELTTKQQQFC